MIEYGESVHYGKVISLSGLVIAGSQRRRATAGKQAMRRLAAGLGLRGRGIAAGSPA
jgi:hypothetical protein